MTVPNTFKSLSSQVRAYYKRAMATPRSHGFHPSEFSSEEFCPVRRYFLEEAHDKLASADPSEIAAGVAHIQSNLKAKAARFRPEVNSELLLGHAIHDLVQYEYGLLQVLYGVWACRYCHAQTLPGFMPVMWTEGGDGEKIQIPAPCPNCNGKNRGETMPWRYVEPSIGWRMFEHETGIKGHVDGDLRIKDKSGNVHRFVLEIKSINDWGFSEGKSVPWENNAWHNGWRPPEGWQFSHPHKFKALPPQKHVSQASIYGVLKGIKQIWFVYVNKNQVSCRKELVVNIDEESVKQSESRMRAVLEARQQNSGPPIEHRYCSDPRDSMAASCEAFEKCFNLKKQDYHRIDV